MPYINIFEGRTETPTTHLFYQLAAERLAEPQDEFNLEKQQERAKYLASFPEARIRVNTIPLREIIPYAHFKCHPFSSVARDESIEGSDIDGGVVITAQRIPEEQQLAFAKELQRQGFSAYHESETKQAEQELEVVQKAWDKQCDDNEEYDWFDDEPEELTSLARKAARMFFQTLHFLTYKDIRDAIREGKLDMPIMIALAGKEIF